MKIIRKLRNIKNKNPWDHYYKRNERTIKVPEMSIYEFLSKCSQDNLTATALNYFNSKTSFETFLSQIDLCAKALKSHGIRENDVVTICMANTPEAVISFYAVNKIGAIANMLHPLSAEEEIKNSLITTNSVMLIAIDLTYSKVKNIINETKVYKTVIVSAADSMTPLLAIGYKLTKGRKVETPEKSERFMYWADFMNRGRHYNEEVFVRRCKDDDALILHSGGTTGEPKNIILTNGNINAIIEQTRVLFPNIGNDDSFLAILPLFHCFGLVVCIHAPLCYGSTCVLVPQFDAKRFDKLLTKYHPTVIAGVPTLFEALTSNAYMHNIDMSYVKYVISGGDSLNVVKNKKVNDFLKAHNCNTEIMQGYGMTESSGPVAVGGTYTGANKLGSVGIPLPGNKVKIVEPTTGIEVDLGEIGEICLAGPVIMKGYLNNEAATNEIIEVDEKGVRWVHTGDLGYMDEDGVIFYVQRLKRMLIVSGYNVYPTHIEETIMSHPDVANCGVIGVPHPYKVQVPKAFIVLKDGVELDSKVRNSIKEHCKKNLAVYMMPKEFEFRESLPKTLVGKVNYKELEKEMKQD